MSWQFTGHITFTLLGVALLFVGQGDAAVAEYDPNYMCGNLECSFTTANVSSSPCNTSLRQFFRILDVNDNFNFTLIGSTDCLYLLNNDLTELQDSQNITASSSIVTMCEFGAPDVDEEVLCKSYPFAAFNNSENYLVCGSYGAVQRRCWNCSFDGVIACDFDRGVPLDNVPRDPRENYTIGFFKDDSNKTLLFVGSEDSSVNVGTINPIFSKLAIDDDTVVDAFLSGDKEKWMLEPLDFVGKPIEHEEHIYFFYRESAAETNHISPTIYSRVGRVCKNDTGGSGNPLNNRFTTFLKTRLNCSVSNYPESVPFNEIQDAQRSGDYVYGLFTTANAGVVSSAICRYSLEELKNLFDKDKRRGQDTPTDNWQSITTGPASSPATIPDDDLTTRQCTLPYGTNSYEDLVKFPLMNTNAPNCGFSDSCSDYTRVDRSGLSEPLAVFERMSGQRLAILNDDADVLDLFIGTNNGSIYQVRVNSTHAYILNQRQLNSNGIEDSIRWTYGISTLMIHNKATVYGNNDHCAFTFPVDEEVNAPALMVMTSENNNCTIKKNLNELDSKCFRTFVAPPDTNMQATFTDMDSGVNPLVNCSEDNYGGSSIEILHITCDLKEDTNNLEWRSRNFRITVQSLSGRSAYVETDIMIDVDESPRVYSDDSTVNDYDMDISKYEYHYILWLQNNVTCDGNPLPTCEAGPCCPKP